MKTCKLICIRSKYIFRKRPRVDLRAVQAQPALMALAKSGVLPRVGGLEALLRRLTGHLPAALLAKHILGWKRGTVYRTARQLEESLGLTLDEIKAAKRILPEMGIECVVGRTRYGRATYYRVNLRRLLAAVARAFKVGLLRVLAAVGVRGASPRPVGGNVTDGSVEIPPTIKHHKETKERNINTHDDEDKFLLPEIREPLGEGRDPLERIGVNDKRLHKTERDKARAWIAYVEQRFDIRNKAAYVAQALREGWAVPAVAQAAQQSNPFAGICAAPDKNPFAGMNWSDFAENGG
jgi:hypothetical protein